MSNVYTTIIPQNYQNLIKSTTDIDPTSVTFQRNINAPIHRWYPYKEGFSQSFVEKMFKRYKINKKSTIIDPFAGSGTIMVEAKKKGIIAKGFELNPFIHFLANGKLNWNIDIKLLESCHSDILNNYSFLKFTKHSTSKFKNAERDCVIEPPNFTTLNKFYDQDTITRLRILKEYWNFIEDSNLKNILMLIFSSLLVDMSNATRSPSLGYKKSKINKKKKVWREYLDRLSKVIEDLYWIQSRYPQTSDKCLVLNDDNRSSQQLEGELFTHLITSPPYLNNIDYIRNTKLELFWCDFVKNNQEFYKLKKEFSRSFLGSLTENRFLDVPDKVEELATRVENAKPFNKRIPAMITAYFFDMRRSFTNMYKLLEKGSQIAIVVGDSCFARVHIPTDLLLCELLESIGYVVKNIEIVRLRRSTFHKTRLRECIIHLTI